MLGLKRCGTLAYAAVAAAAPLFSPSPNSTSTLFSSLVVFGDSFSDNGIRTCAPSRFDCKLNRHQAMDRTSSLTIPGPPILHSMLSN